VRRRSLVSCSLLVLALAATGCGTGQANLWPLYFHETRLVERDGRTEPVTTTEFLYPIFSAETSPSGRWHVVRPLYNYESDASGQRWRVQYLWPFGLHGKRDNGELYSRFFPLVSHSRTWSASHGRHRTHGFIFPFVWWGDHAELGPYFALFPVGGVTHAVLGHTWSFLAFPLFSHYRRGTFVRNDFPWPFFGYGSSPDGKQKMIRLWPLYVGQRYEDAALTRSTTDLLWPLVRWGRMDKGGKHHFKMLKIAPFFSTVGVYDRQGRKVSSRTKVLGTGRWPQGWSALWGMVGSESSARRDNRRFFPFYVYKRRFQGADRDPARSAVAVQAPWPLVWYSRTRTAPRRSQTVFVVAPLYWHFASTSRGYDAPEAERRITIFPLTTWASDSAGGRHLWIPSHGWPDLTKGFKRNYRAFFELFQYHRDARGDRETRILWRLYHHRRTDRGRYLSIGGLFTYDGTGEVPGNEGGYFSVLFGLVQRSRGERGTRWRVLYIPLGGRG